MPNFKKPDLNNKKNWLKINCKEAPMIDRKALDLCVTISPLMFRFFATINNGCQLKICPLSTLLNTRVLYIIGERK